MNQDSPQKPQHPKKTDEPQSDNEEEIEGDDAEEEVEVNEEKASDSPRPTKKSDLDEAVEEQDDDVISFFPFAFSQYATHFSFFCVRRTSRPRRRRRKEPESVKPEKNNLIEIKVQSVK